jgi:hypothetical protein
MEDTIMNPYTSFHPTAADAYTRHLLDRIANSGPLAAHVLAAEERQQDAGRWVAVWAATHAARKRTPGAGRRWLGALLVRAGGRLQGAPAATLAADPAAVAGAAGAAG